MIPIDFHTDDTVAQIAYEDLFDLSVKVLEVGADTSALAPFGVDDLRALAAGAPPTELQRTAVPALVAWLTENRDTISNTFPGPSPPFDHLQSYWENFFRGPRASQPAAARAMPALPTTRLLNFDLGIPFGVPACAITPHSGYVSHFAQRGFDLTTYKTVRPGPWNAHPSPNLGFAPTVGTPLATAGLAVPIIPSLFPGTLTDARSASFVNSIGVPSLDVAKWMEDVERSRRLLSPDQALIVSVMGSPEELAIGEDEKLIKQFAWVAVCARDAGAHIVELNLSCPNTGGELLCRNPELSGHIARRVREAVGTDVPVFIKISYLSKSGLRALVDACRRHVNGIVAINAVPVRAHRLDGMPFFSGRQNDLAGLSGIGIRQLGLEVVGELARMRADDGASPDDWVIVGIGGVSSFADFCAYRDVGADAVQSCTGAWLNPNLADEIRVGLAGISVSRPSVKPVELGADEPQTRRSGAGTWRHRFHLVNDALRSGGLSLRVEDTHPHRRTASE